MSSTTSNRPNQPDFKPAMRIGHGYDLHRLDRLVPDGQGRPFILGGIRLHSDRGPVGHSDADALLHAITDSILGALGEPDIGQVFPDTDPRNESQDSSVFLIEAARRMTERGYSIMNLDATVICEHPKLGPHKSEICSNIAKLLNIDADCVNIKAKTHEGVDAVGEQRAIEVHCVALISADSSS